MHYLFVLSKKRTSPIVVSTSVPDYCGPIVGRSRRRFPRVVVRCSVTGDIPMRDSLPTHSLARVKCQHEETKRVARRGLSEMFEKRRHRVTRRRIKERGDVDTRDLTLATSPARPQEMPAKRPCGVTRRNGFTGQYPWPNGTRRDKKKEKEKKKKPPITHIVPSPTSSGRRVFRVTRHARIVRVRVPPSTTFRTNRVKCRTRSPKTVGSPDGVFFRPIERDAPRARDHRVLRDRTCRLTLPSRPHALVDVIAAAAAVVVRASSARRDRRMERVAVTSVRSPLPLPSPSTRPPVSGGGPAPARIIALYATADPRVRPIVAELLSYAVCNRFPRARVRSPLSQRVIIVSNSTVFRFVFPSLRTPCFRPPRFPPRLRSRPFQVSRDRAVRPPPP